jgi:hypothetical protein
MLAQATCLWSALVAFAVFCTVAGVTNASLWIIPCAVATAFFAAAALLADRSVRKQGNR